MAKETQQKRGMSRRTFGLAAVSVAAGTALGWGIEHSVSPTHEFIQLPHGEVYINLQFHSRGNTLTEIPSDVKFDLHWQELLGDDLFSASPQSILRSVSIELPNPLIFAQDKLVKFARDGTSIVLGDVNIPSETDFLIQFLSGYTEVVLVNLAFILPRVLPLIRGKVLHEKVGREGIPRRTFNVLSASALAFSLSRYLPHILGFLLQSDLDTLNSSRSARLVSQIGGDMSLLHPEEPTIFLRNAIMAHKILSLMEIYSQKLGRPVKLYAEFGEEHGGIRRFLVAGMEACVATILRWYPVEFLQFLTDSNSGLDHISGMRIFTLIPDFNPEFDTNDVLIRPNAIRDSFLIDQDFRSALSSAGVK